MAESLTVKPISVVAPIFTAIGNRNWEEFKRLEKDFVDQYGVEAWEYEFNFRIKPALDKDSDRWLLIQWCSGGIVSIKHIA
ncbi:hypothetical protein NIES267_74410 (plasmid) [Calothrix parasitica NIES-267]|uniref:Uncharacterized protein n=1 Tax=Calothrix parasitica NIES-267 TaxID=1973488 RepID=A0A1Z4M369_9CYAN|nr:hypothetical protein NIES267_74410 [Calothrix parasitica NIES-267]